MSRSRLSACRGRGPGAALGRVDWTGLKPADAEIVVTEAVDVLVVVSVVVAVDVDVTICVFVAVTVLMRLFEVVTVLVSMAVLVMVVVEVGVIVTVVMVEAVESLDIVRLLDIVVGPRLISVASRCV